MAKSRLHVNALFYIIALSFVNVKGTEGYYQFRVVHSMILAFYNCWVMSISVFPLRANDPVLSWVESDPFRFECFLMIGNMQRCKPVYLLDRAYLLCSPSSATALRIIVDASPSCHSCVRGLNSP